MFSHQHNNENQSYQDCTECHFGLVKKMKYFCTGWYQCTDLGLSIYIMVCAVRFGLVVGISLFGLNAPQSLCGLRVTLVVVLSNWVVDLCSSKLPTGCWWGYVQSPTQQQKPKLSTPHRRLFKFWSREQNILVPIDFDLLFQDYCYTYTLILVFLYKQRIVRLIHKW